MSEAKGSAKILQLKKHLKNQRLDPPMVSGEFEPVCFSQGCIYIYI